MPLVTYIGDRQCDSNHLCCMKVHHLNHLYIYQCNMQWELSSHIKNATVQMDSIITLPYLTGKPWYRLVLRPPVGPVCVP